MITVGLKTLKHAKLKLNFNIYQYKFLVYKITSLYAKQQILNIDMIENFYVVTHNSLLNLIQINKENVIY